MSFLKVRYSEGLHAHGHSSVKIQRFCTGPSLRNGKVAHCTKKPLVKSINHDTSLQKFLKSSCQSISLVVQEFYVCLQFDLVEQKAKLRVIV